MLSGERRGSRHRRTSGRWSLLGLGMTGAGLVAVAVAVAVGIGQVAGSAPACAAALSAVHAAAPARAAGPVSGIATHYVLQGGGGNCSYAGPPSDGLYVALSPSEYAAAGACGGYIEVSGPDGSVRVKVIDQCPECKTGHLDLSETAFAKLAPLKAGLINISYSYLANPPLPGPISVIVKPGSSRYWLSLVIDNAGNPLSSVQVSTSSGGWESLSRADYNAWNSASGPGPGPYTVKITDTQGHQVEVRGITLSPGTQETTSAWMYGAGAGQGTVAPPPPPPSPAPVAPSATSPAPTTAAPSRPASASHRSVPAASGARAGVPSARPSATPRRAPSAAVAAVAGTTTPGCLRSGRSDSATADAMALCRAAPAGQDIRVVIPVHDVNPVRRVPWVTYLLVAVNVVVLLLTPFAQGSVTGASGTAAVCRQEAFYDRYAAIPRELINDRPLAVVATGQSGSAPGTCVFSPPTYRKSPVLSVLYSMFLHAGWLHLLGNMLFLVVFGNNIEDRFRKIPYLLFYVFCGYCAAYGYAYAFQTSAQPLIGASGAIAGVLGAYLVLYPRARVWSLLPFLFFIPVRIPAWLVLGSWFVLQWLYSAGIAAAGAGSVAYLAHVFGFLAGAVIGLAVRAASPPPRYPSPPARPRYR